MAVSVQVVRFQKDTSNVDGATQDVNLNFTPKAIIVYSACNATQTNTESHYQWSQGFSDGTNHACCVTTSDDADAAADTGRIHYNTSVYARMLETTNTTVEERATVAFATNKVTFTWAVNSTAATYIHLIAFGGDDITNVKVNTVGLGRNTTGTQDYTGLGFNPTDNNSVIFILSNDTTTSGGLNTRNNGLLQTFGCAVSSTKEWSVCNVSENIADPTDTWRLYSTKVLSNLNVATGAILDEAEFDSWITDGFRLNVTNAPSLATMQFSYLVINGGTWDCGTLTTPTSALANQDYAVSVSSNTIRGLMLGSCSTGTAAVDTSTTSAVLGIGATDGTTQTIIGMIDEDAQTTTDSYRVNSAINILRTIADNGAFFFQATFDSFTTNNFRLDWGVAASATHVGWVVVADGAVGGGPQLYDRPISETSVSVSEALARIQTRTFTLSETAITVSESLARGLVYLKTISDTPAITLNETLVRIPLYKKAISDTPTITTNDSIARWIAISYNLAEPSISVNDSIQGALFYLRSISTNEAAITTNDTIVRLLAATRTITTEPSISINDTIARLQSIIKTITEDTINTDDATIAGLLYEVLLTESRIKWYYSLLTRKIPG